MTATECCCCGRPTPDGWACATCADRAVAHLEEIERLTPDARQVAYGLARRGDGGTSGKPGSRSPGNDEALDALAAVQNTLTTLARDIAETRGAEEAVAAFSRPGVGDPLAEASLWLSLQTGWLRHAVDGTEPYAVRAFAEIEDCARRMRWIVDGPAPRRYLGPCGATVVFGVHPDAIGDVMTRECEGDVYGPAGGKTGTCRTCGAQVDQSERQAWIGAVTRNRAYRASEIEDAHGVKAHSIRMWADRGQIRVHGRDTLGRKLYLLGEVLDHAADMVRRRAEREARRHAARTA